MPGKVPFLDPEALFKISKAEHFVGTCTETFFCTCIVPQLKGGISLGFRKLKPEGSDVQPSGPSDRSLTSDNF